MHVFSSYSPLPRFWGNGRPFWLAWQRESLPTSNENRLLQVKGLDNLIGLIGRSGKFSPSSGKEAFSSLIARNRALRTAVVIADLEPYPSALLAETPRPFRRC